ncbi:MAG TPA: tetraacyldisaccharide 4'-kinase [Epsilonproteobacteria bacterium]|nr:tetraacyldisaccharide 4'-kinase [Campylobacterota bacterium]
MEDFFERLFFAPKPYHFCIILLLFPFSLLYGSLMLFRRFLAKREKFSLPVISIGNLIVGGSGKTPFVIALATRYPGAAIVSRGYGRQSSGLVEVSRRGVILASVEESGDEAMLMAKSLPQCSVIVSENRKMAIHKAIGEGAKLIILDDGFNRVNIEKFDIVLEPESITNRLPFPAGPFREFSFVKRYADLVLKENRDFKRKVFYHNLGPKMLLATAISHPERLDPYLPDGVVARYYLSDHAYFDEERLGKRMDECGADTLLVTQKDAVKMEGFGFPLSIIQLELEVEEKYWKKIAHTIQRESSHIRKKNKNET